MANRHMEKCTSIDHQGNINQNHNEIPPHTSQNGKNRQDRKQQMLLRMWRKGNLPPTLLVGMQAGTATLENSMEVPQDVKNRAIL